MDIKEVEKRSVAVPPPRQTPLSSGPNAAKPTTPPPGQDATSALNATQPDNPNGGLAELRTAVEKIQEFVSAAASDIKFSVDDASGHTVVKVVDRETQEVIRQIPSQEMLDLANALDKLQGLLIKQKA